MKSQADLCRLPRPSRRKYNTAALPDQPGVLNALADDADNAKKEPARIGVLALVEPESLLVEVAEQVKRLDTNVCPANRSLQERPEVLHPVGVDVTANVGNSMVDHVVNVIRSKAIVGAKRIGMNLRTLYHIFAYVLLKFSATYVPDDVQDHARGFLGSVALQQSHDGSHRNGASALGLPLSLVHVAGLAADESLVHFHIARELADRPVLNRQPDSMQHEPCGFLCHTERAAKLARTDSVLGIQDHPEGGQPLIQPEGTVLEDRADLDGELLLAIAAPIQPASGHQNRIGRLAPRTADLAIGPSNRGHELQRAVIVGEVFDCLCESLRKFSLCFHA